MLVLERGLGRVSSQGWWKSIPFILSLAVFFFIAWTTVQLTVFPYDGINEVQADGQVKGIVPSGPADGKLQEGDIVISVDGVPWENLSSVSAGKKPGDTVDFLIHRGEEFKHFTLVLENPPFRNLTINLIPLFVALIFWGIGLGVELFKPPSESADIAFIWSVVCAMTLAAGVASYLSPLWASSLFSSLLKFVGPVSVLFHLYFPQRLQFRGRQMLIATLIFIASLSALPYLLGIEKLRSFSWYPQFTSAGRIFLAFNLLLVVVILYLTYRYTDSPGARGQIRLVALGGGLAALLIVTLTILPDVLLQQPIVPYRFAFVILGLLPLTYAYAIFRLHLIEIEQHVNRGAALLLVYSILGGTYLILYWVIQSYFSPQLAGSALANTILVLALASILVPLYVRVKRFVDTIFYGGWYDYRLAVTQITQGLEQITTDLHTLASTIGERVVETLRLQEATVFLRDPDGDFSVIEIASRNQLESNMVPSYPALPRSSLTYLLEIGVIERDALRKEISQVALYPEELQLLEKEQFHLWVPIIGRGQIQGLLALGPKLGGDVFSGEDMDILRLVARQLGPVIENLHLLTRLRQHALRLEERVNERTAELHNAKERVEAILASVGDGVIVTDLEGNILTVNAAFEGQSGYSASDIVSLNFQDLLYPENSSQTLEEMQAALGRAEVWEGELISRRKNGEFYNVQLTVAPVRDQAGQIISYVGSQRDITRQKELDRMKDIFVADVSHELRTPTTNIGLYLELLETAPAEKRSQYVSIIRQQSHLLTKLVEDILDLSRLAKAKVTNLEFTCIDLNALIEQVIVAQGALAEASKITLRFEPLADLKPVRAEQNQTARLIQNLVSNAIRYTPQGEVTIRTDQLNGQACLVVQDTGIGIPSEDLPHIFERFYRGRNVRQSKTHGTGLGLAIVKEIIDLHGGSIEVQSDYGKGSVFRVWLPLCE